MDTTGSSFELWSRFLLEWLRGQKIVKHQDFQEAWSAIAKDQFKRLHESLGV